jgi:hypothetical protein
VGQHTLTDLVTLMGNPAATAALLLTLRRCSRRHASARRREAAADVDASRSKEIW